MGRFSNDEGVGGFLESILAVMAVITASSVFLVVISAGAVETDDAGPNTEWVLRELEQAGLLAMDGGSVDLDMVENCYENYLRSEGEGVGLNITYRFMGERLALKSLGAPAPQDRTVRTERLPALLLVDGDGLPGVVEVSLWR